jgi:peptidoglycan/LPS O-acetylase OafA/YrhL
MTATLEATPAAQQHDELTTSSSRVAPTPATNWPVLDGVRGIAVIAVVGWHVFRLTATSIDSHTMPAFLWPLGTARFGVDAFFVLSGFLVIRSWSILRVRSSTRARAYWTFARRRAARILPAYWLSLVVFVPLVAPILFEQPRRLALFATVNQYVRFWLPGRVNVVYWSLTVEWHFYLLVPLLAWLLFRFRHSLVLVACLALSVMWWSHIPPLQLPNGFVFGHLDQFVAGAVAAEIATGTGGRAAEFVRRLADRRAYLNGLVVALVAIGTYHGSTMGHSRRALIDAFLHPAVGLVIAAALVALVRRKPERKQFLEHPVLVWFGMISYSLYLWHYPILAHGIAWSDVDTAMPEVLWRPVAIAALLAGVVALAALSYAFVERPFLNRRRPSDTRESASTLDPWPSRRSSASRRSTASCCVARPIPIRSSRRLY